MMEYKYERHRVDKYRKEQVLPVLLAAAKHFAYVEFSLRDFISAKLGISRGGVDSAYGSWSEAMCALRIALRAQGIELAARSTKRISDDELFIEMERIWNELGQRPSRHEWEKSGSKYSFQPYKTRFGGWTNACLRFIEWRMGKPVVIEFQEIVKTPQKIVPTESLPRGPSDRLRLRVLARDGFRCVLCGHSPAIERGVVLHLDHIVPYSKGGRTTFDNLRTLCAACNQGRGNIEELAKGV
jgi:HNH endonuclease/Homing endonuclease associated repeat